MSTPRSVMNGVAALAAILLVGGPASLPAEEPPSPEQLLRQMSAELKKAGALRFHTEISS